MKILLIKIFKNIYKGDISKQVKKNYFKSLKSFWKENNDNLTMKMMELKKMDKQPEDIKNGLNNN